MIRKIRKWLYDHVLEATVKAMLYDELMGNRREIDRLKAVVREKEAEIRGLETGLRSVRRITINIPGVQP